MEDYGNRTSDGIDHILLKLSLGWDHPIAFRKRLINIPTPPSIDTACEASLTEKIIYSSSLGRTQIHLDVKRPQETKPPQLLCIVEEVTCISYHMI